MKACIHRTIQVPAPTAKCRQTNETCTHGHIRWLTVKRNCRCREPGCVGGGVHAPGAEPDIIGGTTKAASWSTTHRCLQSTKYKIVNGHILSHASRELSDTNRHKLQKNLLSQFQGLQIWQHHHHHRIWTLEVQDPRQQDLSRTRAHF